MNQYKVIFEVFHESKKKELVSMTVEAGNKKLASLRAIKKLSDEKPEFGNLFKTIKAVEGIV